MRRIVALAGLSAALALLPSHVGAAPTATRAPFGTGADGAAVEVITLTNDAGMTVRFSTRGAAIMEVSTPDRTGKRANVVIGKPDFAAWEQAGSHNTVVGRYANRITGGGFTLDGRFYKLAGANPTTNIVIHGGPQGFGYQVWRAEPFQRADAAGAVLRYTDPDGKNGFPGALSVVVTYTLMADNVLRIAYEATTTKPTVLNPTNHTYFNLAGPGSGPVYDHVLQVFATRYPAADASTVPTGQMLPVAGTPFDFRRPVRVGERVYMTDPRIMQVRGIDHDWLLDKPAGIALPVALRLTEPKTGRQMEVRTTEPTVRIYTANGFNGSQPAGDGFTMRQGDGIAFETEHFPDSPNKPSLPSTVLRPGETFRSTTEFAFSTDKRPFR